MSLESFTGFIKALVTTNPASADPKSQGDDHIRGIKATLKTQFSGFTEGIAITGTESQVNTVTAKHAEIGAITTTGASLMAASEATQAEMEAGTEVAVRAMSPLLVTQAISGAFTGTKQDLVGADGFQVMPGGLVINWGTLNTTAGSGVATFSKPFATCFAVYATAITTANVVAVIGSKSATTATIYTHVGSTGAGITATVYWLAVGI